MDAWGGPVCTWLCVGAWITLRIDRPEGGRRALPQGARRVRAVARHDGCGHQATRLR